MVVGVPRTVTIPGPLAVVTGHIAPVQGDLARAVTLAVKRPKPIIGQGNNAVSLRDHQHTRSLKARYEPVTSLARLRVLAPDQVPRPLDPDGRGQGGQRHFAASGLKGIRYPLARLA